jgi:YHS domain-containing protein
LKSNIPIKKTTIAIATLLIALPASLRAIEDQARAQPHIALGGHCPVAYQTESKAVKGDPANSATYQGWVYHCSSPDAKKTFEANPGKYVAQYGELCTTALGGIYGNRLPSDPTVFYVIDGKLYLFGSLRARNAFDRDPPAYIAKADKLFAVPSYSGYSLSAYQLDNKAVKGDPKFTNVYQGLVYHFHSQEAADAFEKDPERYFPKYQHFCAEGVSRGKRFPADPANFSVVDGKTYLFFDPKAKTVFDADPKSMIEKADADWKANPGPKKEPATEQP